CSSVAGVPAANVPFGASTLRTLSRSAVAVAPAGGTATPLPMNAAMNARMIEVRMSLFQSVDEERSRARTPQAITARLLISSPEKRDHAQAYAHVQRQVAAGG